jgi:hypothetical protein
MHQRIRQQKERRPHDRSANRSDIAIPTGFRTDAVGLKQAPLDA